MHNIPSARLTVPGTAAGEIIRKNLIDAVLSSATKLVYIYTGLRAMARPLSFHRSQIPRNMPSGFHWMEKMIFLPS